MACGVDYYALFKDNCNTSYAYAYDEKSGTALWTCSGSPDYTVEFCPAGSNYVGAKEASHEYVDAKARCSNIATTFSTTFNVGPSPTSTATIRKLDVVATVATGVDGAAAIRIGETGAASSGETEIAIPTTASQTATAGVVAQTISSPAVWATSAAVLSSDGSDVLAVQATSAAEQGYTSVELFTVYGGSTLYKVIHGTAVGDSEATSTTGGTVALQMPHTDSAGVEGSANTEPGAGMPSSRHRWGEANWLSVVPTGAGDNSQKKRVSPAKVMMNRSRSANNSNRRK